MPRSGAWAQALGWGRLGSLHPCPATGLGIEGAWGHVWWAEVPVGRPGGPWSISGVHLLCSDTGAGGAPDTPPLARTNPSSLCSPHLPAGVCLDPGIWGKGHLGQEADWGGGEGARQQGHLLQLFLSSCPSSGPGAKGTSGLVHPAAAQSPGRDPEPHARAMQPPPSTPCTVFAAALPQPQSSSPAPTVSGSTVRESRGGKGLLEPCGTGSESQAPLSCVTLGNHSPC